MIKKKINIEPVALFDEKTLSFKLQKAKFKKKFDDNTPITSFELKRMNNKLYFVRQGRDRKGNCHLWRARVKITTDGKIVFFRGGGYETCTGVNCAQCSFDDRGGCGCSVGKGGTIYYCVHTISKTSALDLGVFRAR